MPFRLGWRFVFPVALAAILLNVGAVQFVREAYPADPFKSQALAKCLANDPGFIRFISEDRDKCYARQPRQTSATTFSTELNSN
jgi:hypothetical protein